MGFFGNHGILGINARNLLFIRPFNKKKEIRFADDKLKTKHFLSAREIPVPRLYAAIHNLAELEKFDFSSLPDSFVLKPNLGYGGQGIVPVIDRKGDKFVKASGELIGEPELREQAADILEGRYSISGLQDTAFFEQLITCDHRLAHFCYKGLPDIRIVVHNLIPVMAMLRLPTRESDGKANLHQGAVGVGIDMATGKATHVLYKNRIVSEVPELGSIRGFKIPYWEEILLIASKIQMLTNLGYCAVDVAIDENNGPMLLEMNARAGLSVQMANLAPLRRRLERIQGVQVNTPEKGVRVSQDLFGNKIEKEVKKISGKEVVGHEEQVKILAPNEARYVWASMNPLLEESVIDKNLAEELGLLNPEEKENVKLKFVIGATRVQTVARLDNLEGQAFTFIVGKRDLKDFLIDPSKGKNKTLKLPAFFSGDLFTVGSNFLELDEKLVAFDKQIKLLSHLKPINLKEESDIFMKDKHENPKFKYREIGFDPVDLKKDLEKIKGLCDDSPQGQLFLGKTSELGRKIELIESRGSDNFVDASIKLYGNVTENLLAGAKEKLSHKPAHFPSSQRTYPMEYAVAEFERIFKQYGLDHWRIKINRHMVAACSSGKQDTLFIREGATFTEERFRMLVAHEIETHILTAENGKYQQYHLFNRGFGDYLETQEGLAIWNQEQVLTHDVEKNYRSALLVFIVDYAEEHSFAETYDYCLKLGFDENDSFQTVLKVKRGLHDTGKPGAFTKELSYFAGYIQIQNFITAGGNLKDLYYGKYNLKDLELIKKIPGLVAPKILPKFLS